MSACGTPNKEKSRRNTSDIISNVLIAGTIRKICHPLIKESPHA